MHDGSFDVIQVRFDNELTFNFDLCQSAAAYSLNWTYTISEVVYSLIWTYIGFDAHTFLAPHESLASDARRERSTDEAHRQVRQRVQLSVRFILIIFSDDAISGTGIQRWW